MEKKKKPAKKNEYFAIRCKDGGYVLVNTKDQTARIVTHEEALRYTYDLR